MNKSVRHLAVDILTQVEMNHDFASPLLDKALDDYQLTGNPDGRLLTHLVYGVLRSRGHIDWIIAKLYRGNFDNLNEQIKNILRISLFQLKFSERIPSFAVVDEAVKIANKVNPEKSGLINAILRNFLRRGSNISFPPLKINSAQHIASFYSHPLWLVEEWLATLGKDETLALCAANNKIAPLTIRTNTLKISRNELIQKLELQGFDVAPTNFSPHGIIINQGNMPIQKITSFSEGLFRIQDEGAQCISFLLNPSMNDSVLDACAGSGGKTTHLAALMQDQGVILAIDSNPQKNDALTKEAARMGITSIKTLTCDLSARLPEDLRDSFDHVLIDAPCSGTGTLSRNPEIKWRIKQKDINKLNSLQKSILANSSQAVKKGGRLIYCTCSLLIKENEHIVNEFLAQNKHFSLCEPPSSINQILIDNKHFYRTYPNVHNMDGFFAAVLKRD
ncbi:MAG: 16S rRNA (cytosine(967)-C(5))-methyltransferase RsmB [Syntrophaceae bacterium]|nr:16S rRNA (cytosine(967)-C(5))-methyltransferase RsmB [Syntrophaceae bacterium]